MQDLLKPIKAESLKDICVSRFEELILSGALSIGQKLPSERELALQLGVSRPVVHEGLLELAAGGLISIIPRVGTVVNDYRTDGSIRLLNSLLKYHDGKLAPKLMDGLLDMRMLLETETARLAALNRTDDHLKAFDEILAKESKANAHDSAHITELDFSFHHQVSMATDNPIYPLLINSFKEVYTNLAGLFFTDPSMPAVVFDIHGQMVQAIRDRDSESAADLMQKLIKHGEEHLKALVLAQERSQP
jgi:GntR family transcriptional repressor for pyruvate dehydrogenase complex